MDTKTRFTIEGEEKVEYFLRNNTLLKTKQSLTSIDEHVIAYTLAKAQKQLLAKLNIENEKINTSELPSEVVVSITNNEMAKLTSNKSYLGAKGLKGFCDMAGSIRMSFISYIDGYYTNTALIKSFKWLPSNPNEIWASIDKEVYLYLIDYTLNLKDSNIIVDEKKIKDRIVLADEYNDYVTNLSQAEKEIEWGKNKQKQHFSKGYSYVDLNTYKEIKNTHARNIFFKIKHIHDNIDKKNKRNTIKKVYTLEDLKNILMLDGKYQQFYDFEKNVLKKISQEINTSEYFIFRYEVVKNKIIKGCKRTEISFIATPTSKLLSYNKSKATERNPTSNFSEEMSLKLLEESNLNVKPMYIDKFIEKFGKDLVEEATYMLIEKNEREILETGRKVKYPRKYMQITLENMHKNSNEAKNKKQKTQNDNINPMKFNNFEARAYDYDKIENRLRYGNIDNLSEEEYLYDIYDSKKDIQEYNDILKNIKSKEE